jgi:aspartyl aminopeptidase
VAFAVGEKYKSGSGFKVIGAHTDSPNLKIKPNSKRSSSSSSMSLLSVECYGGGLWHTWFDRDLSIAGSVIVRDSNEGYVQKLVKIDKSILRVPNLCIHLRPADEREVFKINKEEHLSPILCSEVVKV